MKYIKGVPDVLVSDTFEIKTVKSFDEDESRIVLNIAEYVPQFVRGYVCNMVFSFPLADDEDNGAVDRVCSHINDLVLVYINKSVEVTSFPEFEYVFYKP